MENEHRGKWVLLRVPTVGQYFILETTSWGGKYPHQCEAIVESDDRDWLVTCKQLAEEAEG